MYDAKLVDSCLSFEFGDHHAAIDFVQSVQWDASDYGCIQYVRMDLHDSVFYWVFGAFCVRFAAVGCY
jgi:hypothetical protein